MYFCYLCIVSSYTASRDLKTEFTSNLILVPGIVEDGRVVDPSRGGVHVERSIRTAVNVVFILLQYRPPEPLKAR
jgi:hypothetical protein